MSKEARQIYDEIGEDEIANTLLVQRTGLMDREAFIRGTLELIRGKWIEARRTGGTTFIKKIK